MSAYKNFQEFWPYYLSEHANTLNRRLHYIGSTIAVLLAVAAVSLGSFAPLLAVPLFGYGFAWFGHFIVEKNRPATFKHPLWSLRGDFRMLKLAASRKLPAELEALRKNGNIGRDQF